MTPFPPSIVYFKITSVETDAPSANGNANGSSRHHPSYYGYGRCVDPAATKMVQTGLEHSRIPPGLSFGRWVAEKNGGRYFAVSYSAWYLEVMR